MPMLQSEQANLLWSPADDGVQKAELRVTVGTEALASTPIDWLDRKSVV